MSVSDNAAHSTATKGFQKYDQLFQGMRDDALYSGPDDWSPEKFLHKLNSTYYIFIRCGDILQTHIITCEDIES